MKIAYLNEIRSTSCYPAFRKFTDIATVLLFILAALIAIAGFASGQGIGILIGSVAAAIIVLLAIVAKELSLMIVDIADATIEVAGRGEYLKNSEGFANETSTQQRKILRSRVTAETEVNTAVSDSQTDFKQEQGPMGSCPNCEAIIPLASPECKKCNASFEIGSAWKVRPL
jgi:hypothetical protein